jgi:NAD(P)-dependent dehydrogenase (short-subunit alcohol dehydrogenase family)
MNNEAESSMRVAIITGAGTGIGAACALLFAKKNHRVVLVGRRAQKLHEVRDAIESLGGVAMTVVADLSENSSYERIVEASIEAYDRLDVLVNNAAMIQTGRIEEMTTQLVDEHYALNVRAPLLLMKEALPYLRKSTNASIVNVSSSLGSTLLPETMLYGSTKAALNYMTRAWAHELAPDSIRVNCIAPGVIDTPIHETYSTDLAATYEDLARRVPLGRMGTAQEVAEWIWFVTSAAASWATGNVIYVDGGHVLGPPQPVDDA